MFIVLIWQSTALDQKRSSSQLVARTGNDGTVILLCCILDEVSSQNKRSGVPPLLTEFLRSQLPAASLSTLLSRAHELTRRKDLLLSAIRSFSQSPQELFWLATACLEASPDSLRSLGATMMICMREAPLPMYKTQRIAQNMMGTALMQIWSFCHAFC